MPAVQNNPDAWAGLDVKFVRNPGRGAHGAVMAGFAASSAAIVVVYPADDDFNAGIIDRMAGLVNEGYDVVCASRFMPGGTMQGCPWLKAVLVRTGAFALNRVARAADQGSDQRFPDVLAPRHRPDRSRIRAKVFATASNCW